MALTEDQITGPGTYTVKLDGLSAKQFKDAVATVSGIDGQRNIYAGGRYQEVNKIRAEASFNTRTKAWTVFIPPSGAGIDDLQRLAATFNATVERA